MKAPMTGLLSKGTRKHIYISLQFKPGEAFRLDLSHYFTATFQMCLCHNRQTFRWIILKVSLLTVCQYCLLATGVLHSARGLRTTPHHRLTIM